MKSFHNEQRQAGGKPTIERDGVFRKSSLSGGGGCVAVAKFADGSVKVRDTKQEDSAELTFTKHEWEVFLKGVHNHEFDV
jgi:predicted secreted Zn-dependent protease